MHCSCSQGKQQGDFRGFVVLVRSSRNSACTRAEDRRCREAGVCAHCGNSVAGIWPQYHAVPGRKLRVVRLLTERRSFRLHEALKQIEFLAFRGDWPPKFFCSRCQEGRQLEVSVLCALSLSTLSRRPSPPPATPSLHSHLHNCLLKPPPPRPRPYPRPLVESAMTSAAEDSCGNRCVLVCCGKKTLCLKELREKFFLLQTCRCQ